MSMELIWKVMMVYIRHKYGAKDIFSLTPEQVNQASRDAVMIVKVFMEAAIDMKAEQIEEGVKQAKRKRGRPRTKKGK